MNRAGTEGPGVAGSGKARQDSVGHGEAGAAGPVTAWRGEERQGVASRGQAGVLGTERLALLVEDFSIYPRHSVDDANISALVAALKSGATLPPITIEAKSKRIVDGWHRARSYKRVLGAEAVVDVEAVTYANEEEVLLDAVRRNSSHGRKLDMIDQVRVLGMCKEHGIAVPLVAKVLHIPIERAEKLSVRLATAAAPTRGTIPGTLSVALKRPAAHLAGTELTPEQADAHDRAPGTSYLLLAHQLDEAVRVGLVNRADERLMEALRHLWASLGEFLKV